MLCCILKHQHQILPFSSLAILSLPQTQNLPYRPMSLIHLLLCLPMIPRSRLLLQYSEAWDTKLSSLTLRAENQQLLLPPAATFQELCLLRARRDHGWLYLLPSPLQPCQDNRLSKERGDPISCQRAKHLPRCASFLENK